MFSWYKYPTVKFFSHLGFWSGDLFLITHFPDRYLLVHIQLDFGLAILCFPLLKTHQSRFIDSY